MSIELDWTYATARLSDQGLAVERAATEDERTEVARALDIMACERLSAAYRITPLGHGRFRLSGALEADVTQACVVTLDPVSAQIREPFEVEFWPDDGMPKICADEVEVLTGDDIEPIVDGLIDVGRIVFEHVSAALNPYPRKEGAAFDWSDPREQSGEKPPGAFAALARLKDRG